MNPRPSHVPLGVAWGLLVASLAVTIGLAAAEVGIVRADDLPGIGALTAAMAALRWHWSRVGGERRATVCFAANLLLCVPLTLLSPMFGLYLFLGYYEASRIRARWPRLAGSLGTALLIALAQLGGPRSPILTPASYAAIVAVNLLITGLMMMLDRRREDLLSRLEAANEELRAEQRRSAALTEQLIEQARESGVSEERARLSREIHDTVAQDLVAIIAQLDALADEQGPAERERRLALVDGAARDALAEARRAVAALASPRLDRADLALALDDLLGQWREGTGLGGELTVRGQPVTEHEDDLLRVAQEALANVAKHARARRADVLLADEPEGVRLTVADDGIGFDPRAAGEGYGLAGMRQRLARLGGALEVDSGARGTRVSAHLPLPTGTDRP